MADPTDPRLADLEAASIPADSVSPRIDDAWLSGCTRNRENEARSNTANALHALRTAPELRDLIGFDEMLAAPTLLAPIPGTPPRPRSAPPVVYPRMINDIDVTRIQELLQRAGLHTLTPDSLHRAIDARASERSYHPARDYLNALEWDWTPRLDKWLSYYLGAEHTPYTSAIGRMFLVAMVARIYRPGCKADYMLILEGDQGIGKSTACAILGGAWFSDSLPDVTDAKEASQHLRGKWLIEIAEMHALSKAGNAALKSFLTRQVEQYRPVWGRRDVHQPRQAVFVGTQNLSAYLHDETGGRRYWPVRVTSVDRKALEADRDQLLAEAVHWFNEGAPWYPDPDFEAEHIRPQQEERFEGDAWEGPVLQFLATLKADLAGRRITLPAVAQDALNLDLSRLGTVETRRITAILRRAGWRQRKSTGGTRIWVPTQEGLH